MSSLSRYDVSDALKEVIEFHKTLVIFDKLQIPNIVSERKCFSFPQLVAWWKGIPYLVLTYLGDDFQRARRLLCYDRRVEREFGEDTQHGAGLCQYWVQDPFTAPKMWALFD